MKCSDCPAMQAGGCSVGVHWTDKWMGAEGEMHCRHTRPWLEARMAGKAERANGNEVKCTRLCGECAMFDPDKKRTSRPWAGDRWPASVHFGECRKDGQKKDRCASACGEFTTERKAEKPCRIKRVMCVETGQIFKSSHQAGLSIGMSSGVGYALADPRHTNGGFHFVYVD